MPAVKVSVSVEVDGDMLEGFPVTRRLEVDQVHLFNYLKADDGNATTFTSLPLGPVDDLQALALRTTEDVTLRLNGQVTGGLLIRQDGVLVALGVLANAGPLTNATINNDTGVAARVRGLGAGS